jgi:phosphate starvation-inducible protein PhoH
MSRVSTKSVPQKRSRSKRGSKAEAYELSQALLENGRAIEEGPKRKSWSSHDLKTVKPLNVTQEEMFREFIEGQHICAHGSAGTGKSYLAVYLALGELLSHRSDIERIIIVRSAVPTRDVGHLPGTLEEKIALYELPYKDMFAEFLGHHNSYQDMKDAGMVQFCTTSFIRGLTWDNAVVIIDEVQNMNWLELDSVITRLGTDSRIILCGDTIHQQDLKRETSGFTNALAVISRMQSFSTIAFTYHDIVRSQFVKNWIMTRDALEI